MGDRKRLAAGLAISAALHAAVFFGPAAHSWFKDRPAAQVMHEERLDASRREIAALKAKRAEYGKGLLASLTNNERIRLPDFLIKSETLDRSIALAEKGHSGIDESFLRSKYSDLLKEAKTALAGQGNPERSLLEFLHRKFSGYFWKSGQLSDVVTDGSYNCYSSSVAYASLLGDATGKPVQNVVLFDEHVAPFLPGSKKRVLQTTAPKWENAVQNYNGCGQIAPTDIVAAGYLVKNGVPVSALPPRLSTFYTQKKTWPPHCPKTGKTVPELDASGGSGLPHPGVKSGMSVPEEFVPNPDFEFNPKKVARMGEALYAVYRLSHDDGKSGRIVPGQDGRALLDNPVIIPSDVNWGELFERLRTDILTPVNHLDVNTSRWLSCTPLGTITSGSMLDLIESKVKGGDDRFSGYTKENYCRRFAKAVEQGDSEAQKKYFMGVPSCPGIQDLMRKRLSGDLDPEVRDWMFMTLGFMGRPEDFSFLQDQILHGGLNHPLRRETVWTAMGNLDRGRTYALLKDFPGDAFYEMGVIWFSDDQELLWDIFSKRKTPNFIQAADWLDARSLSEERYEFVRRASRELPFEESIARIMFERGDMASAVEYIKNHVDSVTQGKAKPSWISCVFPKEVGPLLVPLLESDNATTAFSVSYGLLLNEASGEMRRAAISSLRSTINDNTADLADRVGSALVLLIFGEMPLEAE